MGAAITDLDDPSIVIARTSAYIMGPDADYERNGDVPNVVFPCAALTDGDRISIYYGAADTSVCVCYGYISEILDYTMKHNMVK